MEKPVITGKHLQLSIVITVYQGRKFIEQTLESVSASLDRSSLAAEIIVVNDSPEEDLSFLSKKYPEIIFLNNEKNLGVAKSRNRGRKAARGEFIHFVDYDDWVSKGFYHALEKEIGDGADLVLFNVVQHAGNEAQPFYRSLFSFYFPYGEVNASLRQHDQDHRAARF